MTNVIWESSTDMKTWHPATLLDMNKHLRPEIIYQAEKSARECPQESFYIVQTNMWIALGYSHYRCTAKKGHTK